MGSSAQRKFTLLLFWSEQGLTPTGLFIFPHHFSDLEVPDVLGSNPGLLVSGKEEGIEDNWNPGKAVPDVEEKVGKIAKGEFPFFERGPDDDLVGVLDENQKKPREPEKRLSRNGS